MDYLRLVESERRGVASSYDGNFFGLAYSDPWQIGVGVDGGGDAMMTSYISSHAHLWYH